MQNIDYKIRIFEHNVNIHLKPIAIATLEYFSKLKFPLATKMFVCERSSKAI